MMWPFRKKSDLNQNMFHGFDLNVWDYLGWTEIKYDGVPNLIHFFWKKDNDVRAYTLTGRPAFHLKEVAELHSFVHKTCELWRISELDIYSVIRNPSIFFKEWVFSDHGYVWDIEKSWWVLASDQDRYNHSVLQHQKKHPEIYTKDNIVTVNFKTKE